MISIQELRKLYKAMGIPTVLDDGFNLLLETASKKNPLNILEVGTATGMSGTALLLSCPNAHLTTIEILETCYLEAEKNFKEFGVDTRVTQLLGDSLEVLKNIQGKFDFVFLDGSKSKYKKCLDLIEPHLANGAIVVADNVLFRGYVMAEKCPRRFKTIAKYMKQFIDYITNSGNYETTLYQMGDGLTVSKYLKGE